MRHTLIRFLATIFVIWMRIACVGEAVAVQPVIVAFGDSTTAPRGELVVYATLVEKGLSAKGVSAEVINAGVPGNTTADARARFDKDVLARNPRLVVIQFGINDAAVDVWKQPPATDSRVSQKQYETNLRHFVQTLKERGAQVILMTPNPCRWTPELRTLYGKPPYRPDDPDGFNVLLKRYADIVRRAATQENVTLIDVYGAFETYGRKSGQSIDDLLPDGMHPNAKGHRLVAELVLALKVLSDLNHNDVDGQSPHPR